MQTYEEPKEPVRLVCACCHGKPKTTALCFVNTGEDYTKHYSEMREMVCHVCDGRGWNHWKRQNAYLEAKRAKQERVERGESLRDAAKRLGIKEVELSEYERGKKLPPNE